MRSCEFSITTDTHSHCARVGGLKGTGASVILYEGEKARENRPPILLQGVIVLGALHSGYPPLSSQTPIME